MAILNSEEVNESLYRLAREIGNLDMISDDEGWSNTVLNHYDTMCIAFKLLCEAVDYDEKLNT